MRSATRLLVVTLTGLVVALLPVQALAESHPTDREYGLVAHHLAQPTTTEPSTPTSGAGTVDIGPSEEEQSRTQKRKIVMGVASAVLLGVVIWGRSVRRKRAKAKS